VETRRTLNLAILVVLLSAAAISPALGQTPPEKLLINLEVEVPPPPAEVLSFSHSARGPIRPGAQIVFEAKAIVPEGGSVVVDVAGTSWTVPLRSAGGENYRATATVPKTVRPGQYGVNVRIEGADSPKAMAAPSQLVVQAAPKPKPAPKPVVVPKPGGAAACREVLAQVGKLPVRFPFDTAEPTAEGAANLNRIVELLSGINGQRNWKLTVTGHCDPRGSTNYNQWLGGARAKQVKEILVARTSVPSSNIFAMSRGASEPIDTSPTEAGYAKNRRVEFALSCGK